MHGVCTVGSTVIVFTPIETGGNSDAMDDVPFETRLTKELPT